MPLPIIPIVSVGLTGSINSSRCYRHSLRKQTILSIFLCFFRGVGGVLGGEILFWHENDFEVFDFGKRAFSAGVFCFVCFREEVAFIFSGRHCFDIFCLRARGILFLIFRGNLAFGGRRVVGRFI